MVKFPYLPAASGRGDASLMPILPIDSYQQGNEMVHAQGLLDSGATVNVLPYGLGLRLGLVWETQKTKVTLGGNLATQEARAVLVNANVANFEPVRLVFAWTRVENVPLILGQVNFFDQFVISFHRTARYFELARGDK